VHLGILSSSAISRIDIPAECSEAACAAFTAAPGHMLFSADYSQIELRILAHFSGDAVLTEAFRTGQNIHSRTAQEVFGVGPMAQAHALTVPLVVEVKSGPNWRDMK